MIEKQVVFRVDASLLIGSGHIMRCLTLAKAMQNLGWSVQFLSKPHQGNLIEWLSKQGVQSIKLPLPTGVGDVLTEQQDVNDSLAALKQPVDLLVIDHYALGQNYSQQLRQKAKKIMLIDDLANRFYEGDLLLDQNLFTNTQQRYQGKVNKNCQLLLGPQYALLREEFYAPLPKVTNQEKRLLVFFSAADQHNLTLMAICAIAQLKDIDLLVDIVISNAHPEQARIIECCHHLDKVTLHIQTTQMAQLMANADLMLGGGGATHWERCTLGLPALVLTLADNQVETTQYLHKLGACKWLRHFDDVNEELIKRQLQLFLQTPELLVNMSKAAKNIMGKGCLGTAKVMQAIEAQLT